MWLLVELNKQKGIFTKKIHLCIMYRPIFFFYFYIFLRSVKYILCTCSQCIPIEYTLKNNAIYKIYPCLRNMYTYIMYRRVVNVHVLFFLFIYHTVFVCFLFFFLFIYRHFCLVSKRYVPSGWLRKRRHKDACAGCVWVAWSARGCVVACTYICMVLTRFRPEPKSPDQRPRAPTEGHNQWNRLCTDLSRYTRNFSPPSDTSE